MKTTLQTHEIGSFPLELNFQCSTKRFNALKGEVGKIFMVESFSCTMESKNHVDAMIRLVPGNGVIRIIEAGEHAVDASPDE